MMSELNELTYGKQLPELVKELSFQIEKIGESIGGTICGHIMHSISVATSKLKEHFDILTALKRR